MAVHRTLRKIATLALKLGVAVGLLVWLVRGGKLNFTEIWHAIRHNPGWLAVAFLIYNGCVMLTSLRWRMLLFSQGLRPTVAETLGMTYIGCFFSCILPGGTGGDLVKAYYVARDTHKRAEAVTTVFLDRVLGLYCMIGLAAVALLFHAGHLWHYGGTPALLGLTQAQLLVVGVLGGFVAITVGLVAFLSSHCRRLVHWLLDKLPARLASVLKRIYEAVYLYRTQPGVLVKFVLYSVAAHSLMSFVLFLVGRSLAEPVALGGARAFNYLFLIPLGVVLNGLPIAPAGVGVFEWALDFLFGSVLVAGEANRGASVAAVGHVIILLTNQIGLIFYLRGKRRVTQAMHEADEDEAHDTPPEPSLDASA